MRSPSVFPSGLATRRLMTVLIPPACTFSCRRLLRDWAAAGAGVEHLHGAVAEVGVDRCAHRRRASCDCSTSRRIHGAASRGWLPRMSSMVRWVHAEAGGESLGVRGVVGGAGLGEARSDAAGWSRIGACHRARSLQPAAILGGVLSRAKLVRAGQSIAAGAGHGRRSRGPEMANSKELRRQLRECVGLVHLASREPDEDRADRLFLTSMRTLVEAGRPIQRRTTLSWRPGARAGRSTARTT